jgi:anti-sigma factor RsiW
MKDHIPFERLSEYVDGTLDEGAKRELESHLTSCSLCRKELESLRKLCDALHSFRCVKIKDHDAFVRGTMKRLRSRTLRHIVYHYLMPASAAAVVLFFAGVSIFDSAFQSRSMSDLARQKKPAASQPAAQPVPQQTQIVDVDYEDNVGTDYRIKDIRRILEKNGAQVTKVTGDYVEAEALLSDYQNIRGDFDFTALPPMLAGRGMNLAGAGGSDMFISSANRRAQVVTFRIRRK